MSTAVCVGWNERLVTGLPDVDDQHRTLIGLINALGARHGSGAAAAVHAIFGELECYAAHHFDTEERLMRDHGVAAAAYDAHCRSHQGFVALLRQARGLVAVSPDDVARQLTAYLLKWLVFHIGGEDLRMARAIGARMGLAPLAAPAPVFDEAVAALVDELYDELGKRTLEVLALNARLREELEHSHRLAHFDALTDLPNRLLFRSRLEQALALARRRAERLALLYVDLDGFKPINDRHGHDVGDAILRAAAQRLTGCIRESDVVCRHGGDEFLVLLSPLGDDGGADEAARRIVAAVAASYEVDALSLHVTASIGISYFPDHGDAPDALVASADAGMYCAKRAGGNGWVAAGERRFEACRMV